MILHLLSSPPPPPSLLFSSAFFVLLPLSKLHVSRPTTTTTTTSFHFPPNSLRSRSSTSWSSFVLQDDRPTRSHRPDPRSSSSSSRGSPAPRPTPISSTIGPLILSSPLPIPKDSLHPLSPSPSLLKSQVGFHSTVSCKQSTVSHLVLQKIIGYIGIEESYVIPRGSIVGLIGSSKLVIFRTFLLRDKLLYKHNKD